MLFTTLLYPSDPETVHLLNERLPKTRIFARFYDSAVTDVAVLLEFGRDPDRVVTPVLSLVSADVEAVHCVIGAAAGFVDFSIVTVGGGCGEAATAAAEGLIPVELH